MFLRFCILLCLVFSTSFSVFAATPANTTKFTFEASSQQWVGDFTDYPEGQEQFFQLAWGWENLPASQAGFKKGIFLAGNNHSDDLFMFIKTPVTGLIPNTTYAVTISVNFASNVPEGLSGIGGSPGESVYFKVGASTEEPKKIMRKGSYILNVDKGNQARGGKNAVVVGNLANPLVNPEQPQFAPKQVGNTDEPIVVQSDETGKIWVFVGTDSGFEGTSKYYIGDVDITLQQRS